ncbi:MAG TPA: STAS domain-containing protein [Candidatus Baltobacteraceae bacterium]|nr:STAS domain-containing protein [Candidatus Baltobacteraceae bacterium]
MLQATNVKPVGAPRAATVIDLIGDLDSTLAQTFNEALGGALDDGESNIVLDLKHVASVHADGLTAVVRTIAEARLRGCAIAVLAHSRHVRTLLSCARIRCADREVTLGRGHERHVMIARHASG